MKNKSFGDSIVMHVTHRLLFYFTGVGKSHNDAASVRTTHPIPAACGLYYFEVKIISKGRDGYMGIGLTAQNFKPNRLPGKICCCVQDCLDLITSSYSLILCGKTTLYVLLILIKWLTAHGAHLNIRIRIKAQS